VPTKTTGAGKFFLKVQFCKSEFEAKLPTLIKTQPVIFIAPDPMKEHLPVCRKFHEKGYSSVKAFKGGVEAWKEADIRFKPLNDPLSS
jgi:hypothetical protein